MNRHETEWLDLRRMDNMELMREFPDKHFDLAIVDPPYGIGEDGDRSSRPRKTAKWQNPRPKEYKAFDDTRPPGPDYFAELKRVSRNQIIWGANHFLDNIPGAHSSPCWIVWDKLNGETDFADGETAWTSFKTALRIFRHLWSGFQKAEPEQRIHPTQKPVALYRWLLANYAKPGQKILDTHLGSGSIAIACHYARLHLTACELDEDYFAASIARIKRETAQESFDFDAATPAI